MPRVISEDSPNMVKVLNRVKCHETIENSCYQNTVKAIWQLCMNRGYVTSIPSGKVISSREIKELVSGSSTIEETVSYPVERTDEYGIVTIDNQKKSEMVTRQSKGYCIGSEYLLK